MSYTNPYSQTSDPDISGAMTSTCSMGDIFDESPCLYCEHKDENKNFCKTLPDCPLNIPTILPMDLDSHYPNSTMQKIKKVRCRYGHGDCDRMINPDQLACDEHANTVRYRMREGVPDALVYLGERLPWFWRDTYGIQERTKEELKKPPPRRCLYPGCKVILKGKLSSMFCSVKGHSSLVSNRRCRSKSTNLMDLVQPKMKQGGSKRLDGAKRNYHKH